jgi:hypothetical protein
MLGAVVFTLGYLVRSLPVVGPLLGFLAIAYFLVAVSWAFGHLAWRDGSRWSVE